MSFFKYTHTVGFEETNLVGNVYYVNYLRWQGRCREMFLKKEVKEVLVDLQHGLCLVTTRVECDMYEEVSAFDTVEVRMWLEELGSSLIVMEFEYFLLPERCEGKDPVECECRVARRVARGRQHIRCARRVGGVMTGCEVPSALRAALLRYTGTGTADGRRGSPGLPNSEGGRP